jgi:DNA-directed RNA polymerase subunit RPC12/RpoP
MPMIIKICKNCNKSFEIDRWRLKDRKRGKFCSVSCTRKYFSGKRSHYSGVHKLGKNSPSWKGGKPNCIECGKELSIYYGKRCKYCNLKLLHQYLKGKKRLDVTGEKHWNWKGNNVKYRGLHKWVQNHLGKATKCVNDLTHKSTRYHWANISQKYKRDFTDWRQLCPSCNLKEKIGRGINP